MTPKQRAESLGAISLAHVSHVTKTPTSTLYDWFKNYPIRFDAMCVYTAKVEKDIEEMVKL